MKYVTVYRVSRRNKRTEGPFTSDYHSAKNKLHSRCRSYAFPPVFVDISRFKYDMLVGVTSKKMLRYWFPLTVLRVLYRDGFTVWRLQVPAGHLHRGRSKTQAAFHRNDASKWEALTLEQLFPTKQG